MSLKYEPSSESLLISVKQLSQLCLSRVDGSCQYQMMTDEPASYEVYDKMVGYRYIDIYMYTCIYIYMDI